MFVPKDSLMPRYAAINTFEVTANQKHCSLSIVVIAMHIYMSMKLLLINI